MNFKHDFMRYQQRNIKNTVRNVSLWFFSYLGLLIVPASSVASTLMEAYEKAVAFDPIFRSIKHETSADQEIYAQARSFLLPNVRASYSETNRSQDIIKSDIPSYSVGSTNYPITDYGVTVSQSIYSYKNWARLAEAKLEQSRSTDQLVTAKQDLMLRLALTYLDVLNANEDYQSVQAESRSLQKHFQVINTKTKDGLARRTDLLDAQARKLEAESREIDSLASLRDRLTALANITGQKPDSINLLDEDLKLALREMDSIETWIEIAVENNPNIKAAAKAVKAAERRIAVEKGERYPTVDLTLNYNNNDSDGSLFSAGGQEAVTEDVRISVNFPIYTGGATSSRIRAAEERNGQALQQRDQEILAVKREVEASYDGIVSSIVKVEALEKSVESYELAAKAKSLSYNAGLVAIIDVLDAERDLFNGRREYATARYSYLFNTLRLKPAILIMTN